MNELEGELGTSLWNGDFAAAQKLLHDHPQLSAVLSNPEQRGNYFERAAQEDYLDVLQLLMKHGADIHAPLDQFVNVGIIYPAIQNGALNVTSWLLEQGAEIHDECDGVRRCQPLLFAAQEGNLAMVKLLVEKGKADINATWCGNNALKFATNEGHSELADYLRAQGAKLPSERARK